IDDGSSFEEEFVGLTVDMDDGRNNFSGEFPDEAGDNKRSPFAHSLGGILTMWDSRVFDMEQCLKDRNFLRVIGSWVGVLNKIGLLNVYAPQLSSSKEALNRDEWNGFQFHVREASSFNDFISRNGLFDFPLCGRRFTRFDKDGRKASKLDRLRLAIKDWINNRMVAQNLAKESLMKNLLEWDMKPKNALINTNDILNRKEWMMDLNHLDQLHHDDLKQKGRVRWVVKGDENTRFFHSTLNKKFVMFTMKGIHINGVWVKSPDDIKAASLDHFSSRFKEDVISRPSFSSNHFRKSSTTGGTF
ncbi:hypothetical protein Tco_0811926, partial [Tanacetum coccineum]